MPVFLAAVVLVDFAVVVEFVFVAGVVLAVFAGIPRFNVGGPPSALAAAATAGEEAALEGAAVEAVALGAATAPLLYPASRARANPCIFDSTAARSAASSHGRANSCGSRFEASDTATI